MSVCVECLIKSDFQNYEDLQAVEIELKRVAKVLNELFKLEGDDKFVIDSLDIYEYSIRCDMFSPNESCEVYKIVLKRGYWHLETAWRYSAFFTPGLRLRQEFVDIAKALGQHEAWYCDEFHLDNCGSPNWDYDTQSFDEWQSFAESKLGTKIPEYPVEEIKAFIGDWFSSKPIYHDSF